MAVNYIIASDETYNNAVLPDSVIAEFGLPTTTEDEDGNVTPIQWTLKDVDKPNMAGDAFPVQEDENGVPFREFDGAPTDWVFPLGSTGRNMIAFIDHLADIKPIDRNWVFLSVKQTQEYLKYGALPVGLSF